MYKAIKDLDIYISDGNYSSKYPRNEEFVEEGIPFIRANNLAEGDITDEDMYFITPEKHTVLLKGHVKTGDILITTRGNIGQVAIVPDRHEDSNINAQIVLLRTKKENLYNRYLLWALQSQSAKEQYVALQTGTALKQLPVGRLEQLRIKIIGIEGQHKVAKNLDQVFRLIQARQKELTLLDDLIKARFVEMFDKCSEEILIGDVISICRGASPRPIQSFITDDPDGVNWIKIGDVSENSLYIMQTAERITKEGAKKSRAVHRGDFILSNSMSFGRPYILGIEGCVHDGWLILSDFRDTFDELYLYHALRSEHVQHQFSGKVNGATVKNLNSDLVKETYIKVPEMKEQETFADFVKQVDKTKVVVQKSLDETQKLFDSLMQQYFG